MKDTDYMMVTLVTETGRGWTQASGATAVEWPWKSPSQVTANKDPPVTLVGNLEYIQKRSALKNGEKKTKYLEGENSKAKGWAGRIY